MECRQIHSEPEASNGLVEFVILLVDRAKIEIGLCRHFTPFRCQLVEASGLAPARPFFALRVSMRNCALPNSCRKALLDAIELGHRFYTPNN